jgi:hypothetical protein
MAADPLLPAGWQPGAQAVVAVGRADGRADVVAAPSGRVLASLRAPTQAAVGAAQAQAPTPQRGIKHEQLADDPRRVVALAFFLADGGGSGGSSGSGGGAKPAGKRSQAAATAPPPPADPWPRLLVLHATGLACVYRLGPEVLQQQQQQQQQHEPAPAAAAEDGAPPPARPPPLAPEATFQASLNARCAALDPGAAAAVRAWRLPAGGAPDDDKKHQPPSRPPLLAVGSEGTALSLYDLLARRRVWQAKSPKPDRTGLAERPHHTAVAFLPGVPEEEQGAAAAAAAAAGGGGGGKSGGEAPDANEPPVPRFVLLVGTAVHKVHVYDTAVGKRPQASAEWGSARITAIVPQRGEEAAEAGGAAADLWAADGMGRAGALELRGLGADGAPAPKAPDGSGGLALRTPSAGASQGVLRGAAGSVRAVAVLPRGRVAALQRRRQLPGKPQAAAAAAAGGPREVVAVVGLDRHVRLYDARTHACVGRVYAKQQLTGAVWVPPAVVAAAVGAAGPAAANGAAAVAVEAGADEVGEGAKQAPRQAKAKSSGRREREDEEGGERRQKKKAKKGRARG